MNPEKYINYSLHCVVDAAGRCGCYEESELRHKQLNQDALVDLANKFYDTSHRWIVALIIAAVLSAYYLLGYYPIAGKPTCAFWILFTIYFSVILSAILAIAMFGDQLFDFGDEN